MTETVTSAAPKVTKASITAQLRKLNVPDAEAAAEAIVKAYEDRSLHDATLRLLMSIYEAMDKEAVPDNQHLLKWGSFRPYLTKMVWGVVVECCFQNTVLLERLLLPSGYKQMRTAGNYLAVYKD